MKQFILLVTIIAVSSSSFAGFYMGACSSQGSWVTSALSFSEEIIDAINELKDDPNCAGIESVVPNLDRIKSDLYANSNGGLSDYLKMNQELKDYRYLVQDGNAGFKAQVMSLLSNRMFDGAKEDTNNGATSPAPSLKEASQSLLNANTRASAVMKSLMDGMNQTMLKLPNFRSCFNNRPNQGVALMSALIRMSASAVDGGEGVTSRFGEFISNFVMFLRNDKYGRLLAQTNEQKYWSSMSCLIESTAQAYCTAKDAYALLEDQKEVALARRTQGRSIGGTPLEGYKILVRELPKITKWLQTVLNGQTPKMTSQAEFQKRVVDSQANLIKDKLQLEGFYNEQLNVYRSTMGTKGNDGDDLLQAKRTFIADMVIKMNQIMYYGDRNAVNFFEITKAEAVALFWMVGMSVPDELTKANAAQSPTNWLKVNVNSLPQFKNPDDLILQIRINLNRFISQVLITGTDYFTTWFIPDPTKVVDEALTTAPPNVYQSFQNINNYLDKNIQRFMEDRDVRVGELLEEVKELEEIVENDPEDLVAVGNLTRLRRTLGYYKSPSLISSLIDTRRRISKVLKAFEHRTRLFCHVHKSLDPHNVLDACEGIVVTQNDVDEIEGAIDNVDNLVEKRRATVVINEDFFLNIDKLMGQVEIPLAPNSSETIVESRFDQALKRADKYVLEEAFEQFNVMLQRETFLPNRLHGYVMNDYMERVQDHENQDEYLRDLLAVTGNNIIDKISAINTSSPNSTRLDLSQAQPINIANLEVVERLLALDLEIAICKITSRLDDGSKKAIAQCKNAKVQMCQDDENYCKRGWKHWPGMLSDGTFGYGSNARDLLRKDDEFGSFSHLRAKYCIQSLSFPTRWKKFKHLCAGKVLKSEFERIAEYDNVEVNTNYDDFYSMEAGRFLGPKKMVSTTKDSERICALRDFVRKNHVYWLLNNWEF